MLKREDETSSSKWETVSPACSTTEKKRGKRRATSQKGPRAAGHLELDRICVELSLVGSRGDDTNVHNTALPVVFAEEKIQRGVRPSRDIDDLDNL